MPSRIISIDDLAATVEVYGARKEISLMLLPEPAELGEYVLVHAGFAIQKVDEDAAKEALSLITRIVEEMEREENETGGGTGAS